MNQKELKELIEFLIEKDIAEFELERGDVKLRVKRGGESPEVRYVHPHMATAPILGVAHAGEMFYLFARLDPYEQAELMQKQSVDVSRSALPQNVNAADTKAQGAGQTVTRPRRANPR